MDIPRSSTAPARRAAPSSASLSSTAAASSSRASASRSRTVTGGGGGSVSRTSTAAGTAGGARRASGAAGRDRHAAALEAIRDFLRGRSSYDVLPVSFRLVVLDTRLVVKPALDVMWQAGVVSAPLWHSHPPAPALPPAGAAPSSAPQNTSALAGIEEDEARVPGPAGVLSAASRSKAPTRQGFAGMLTVSDIIHLIQYYYQHSSYDDAARNVERFRLEMLRDIEQALHVPTPPLVSIAPLRPLYEACQLLIQTHARRMPLLDHDEQTGLETLISVLTQYRVLKFIAMNCRETAGLHRSVRSLGIGTYVAGTHGVGTLRNGPLQRGSRSGSGGNAASRSRVGSGSAPESGSGSVLEAPAEGLGEAAAARAAVREEAVEDTPAPELSAAPAAEEAPQPTTPVTPTSHPYEPLATATLDTTVFDVVHMFSERGISAVPILDDEGYVVDMYETVDVIDLVRSGAYQSLDTTIRQALARRPADFPGVMTCGPDDSLASIFALLRSRRVHRLLILEPPPLEAGVASPPPTGTDDAGEALPPPVRPRGRLVGILCLSDILRYVVGVEHAAPAPRERTTSQSSAAMSMSGQPRPQTPSVSDAQDDVGRAAELAELADVPSTIPEDSVPPEARDGAALADDALLTPHATEATRPLPPTDDAATVTPHTELATVAEGEAQ